MNEMCPICGLPKPELCTCEQLAKERQKIKIRTTRRRFKKLMTLISGFDEGVDVKPIGKILKRKLACGGTVKDGVIELQGEQTQKAYKVLLKQGFTEEQIDVL